MESPVQDRSREEESEQEVVQLDAEANEKEDGEENELEKVKQDLQKTKAELDEAKSEVAVAQILQENLCSVSRQKAALEEELATMQILLSEATMDSQDNLVARLRTKYSQLKSENQDLKVQLSLLEPSGEQNGVERESLMGGAAVLSGVTKNIAKRVTHGWSCCVVGGDEEHC